MMRSRYSRTEQHSVDIVAYGIVTASFHSGGLDGITETHLLIDRDNEADLVSDLIKLRNEVDYALSLVSPYPKEKT